MLKLSGYAIQEQLYTGNRSTVFRARRSEDQKAVVIKAPAQQFPSAQDLTRLRSEFEMGRAIDDPHVIHYYALAEYPQGLALVQEDFGGVALAGVIPEDGFELSTFLHLAIQLAAGLEAIHRSGMTHRHIHSHNIVINPKTRVVKFTDFGMASRLMQDTQPATRPPRFEGILAYMSPEQTGRMNQPIDCRSDFYSLGVTFYQMLTGSVPFPSDDALEVVHGHLAITPRPVHEINPGVPQPVSAIVDKLLAKASNARYQSAHGLKADLRTCLTQWTTNGRIEYFRLGQYDFSERFLLPQKLYGREQEVDALLQAFERVAGGRTEVIFIAGDSGIGKTSVVYELHKPCIRQRGYFISGKFDQKQRNIPYSAIREAFRQLLQQILTESDEAVAIWRQELQRALGSHAQVIIDVLPELELIMGRQPPVAPLEGKEAQNRFVYFFQKFVSVFATKDHPLIIFFDDLQWAGSMILYLLQDMLFTSGENSLLLIGAYRDNEVDQNHPLMSILKNINLTNIRLSILSLDSLKPGSIDEFIDDTFHCSKERSRLLAELVYEKTAGNPFFVKAFLRSLYEEHLLQFSPESGWVWDIDQIRDLGVTDNVVDLMLRTIHRLPTPAQEVLKLAACIGHHFGLSTLATIYERSEEETSRQIVNCLREGLVVNVDGSYQFAHDRIQQAVYALMDEGQKEHKHLAIGRLLLENRQRSASRFELSEERPFEIVTHLNIGINLVTQQTERDEIARLNLLAGRKAKAATAYPAALSYYKAGLEWLQPPQAFRQAHGSNAAEGWQRHYDLTLDLCGGAAETAYLSTEFAEMGRWTALALQQARTLLDEVKVYEVSIQGYVAQSRLSEAIKIGLDVLKRLNIDFSEATDESQLLVALKETQAALAGRSFEDLLNLPDMRDPYTLAALRIMARVIVAAHVAAPKLMALIVFKMVHLSVEFGRSPETAYAYALYGMLLCARVQEVDVGYELGQLAVKLIERGGAEAYKAKTNFLVYWSIFPWKEPVTNIVPLLAETYHTGLEIGDLEFAALAGGVYCVLAYFAGKELVFIEHEMATYYDGIRRLKQEPTLHMMASYYQTVLNLLGCGDDPCRLVGEIFNEQIMLPHLSAANNGSALLQLYFNKMVLCYVFEAHARALEYAAMAEQYLERATGWMLSALFYFYASLARLRRFPEAAPPEQEQILQKVAADQERLATWAKHAPMNHLHKWYLVEAERARVLHQEGEARVAYDKAIELAYQHDYSQDAALANELAAKFYLAHKREGIAKLYLQEAYASYLKWGATAKIKWLEEHYPEYLKPQGLESGNAGLASAGHTSIQTTDAASLDFATALKAAQALSSEIEQGKLLTTMLGIVVENAGAQRGVFLAEHNGQFMIVARGQAEQPASTDLAPLALESSDEVSPAIINYVRRTRESLVIDDAMTQGAFVADPYLIQHQPKSIVCMPVTRQAHLVGILYLENNLATHAFTPQRLALLQVLSSQMAISLENARFYAQMQREIDERKRAEASLQKALAEVAQLKDRVQAENVYLRQEILRDHDFEEIVGRSPALTRVLHQVDQVAATDTTVLILGETGTGKELIARAIHGRSRRKTRSLVKVNCASIPPTLIESEFFGHERGAFTGALMRKVGRFELADGGTIFLDEIGELPLDLQAKLLRVLQEGEFERLGSAKTLQVDVRVIAATNRHLEKPWPLGASGRICTIASMSFRSPCHRCGSGATIFHSWCGTSSPSARGS